MKSGTRKHRPECLVEYMAYGYYTLLYIAIMYSDSFLELLFRTYFFGTFV
jgi:hypothetical protein